MTEWRKKYLLKQGSKKQIHTCNTLLHSELLDLQHSRGSLAILTRCPRDSQGANHETVQFSMSYFTFCCR